MATTTDTVETSKTVAATMTVAETEHLRSIRDSYEMPIWRLVVDNEKIFAESKGSKANCERVLARYVILATNLAKSNSEELYSAASYGLGALEHGMWEVADRVSKDVRFAASTSAALSEVMRGLVAFVLCVVMLGYISASLLIFIPGHLSTTASQLISANSDILIGTCFGLLGSIVSLLLRLPEFDVMKGRSRQYLFLTGFTLPIVGGIFAAVISALFASHVISFSLSGQEQGPPSIRLYFLIGFLSGFSERFSRTLMTSVENRLTASLDGSGKSGRVAAATVRSETIRERHVENDDRAEDKPQAENAEVKRGIAAANEQTQK